MEELEYKILKSLEKEGDLILKITLLGLFVIVGFLIYAII